MRSPFRDLVGDPRCVTPTLRPMACRGQESLGRPCRDHFLVPSCNYTVKLSPDASPDGTRSGTATKHPTSGTRIPHLHHL